MGKKEKVKKVKQSKKVKGFKSVKQRILVSIGILVAIVLIYNVLNILGTRYSNKQVDHLVNGEMDTLIKDEELAQLMARQNALALSYALTGDSEHKVYFQRTVEESQAVEEALLSSEHSKKAEELINRSDAWRQIIENEVFTEVDKGNSETARQIMSAKVLRESNEIMNGFVELAKEREEISRQAGQDVIDYGKLNVTMSMIISVILLIVSIVLALWIARAISNPIRTVMARMKQIADGDVSQEPLPVTSRDEMGQLTASINEVNANLKDIFQKLGEVSGTVSAHSEELTQSANEVKVGMEQVAATMEQLSAGAEVQASSAGSISETMSDLLGRIDEANDNGEQVQQSSGEVLHLTNKGSELMGTSSEQMTKIDRIMQDAVQKMVSLDAQSEEITNLVSVIKGIASQTNLLALNAAIEAARAGEHGKGFAVVADEVRKLAEQVDVSVQEITDIVEKMQKETKGVAESLSGSYEEVEKGTKDIQATVETFTDIQKSVNQMVENFSVITSNLNMISDETKNLNGNVSEIASITEEASAGIEQTSASSQQVSSSMEEVVGSSNELARLAEQLNDMLRKYSK
ncbi:methyl-accepting chemotaxis protein [Chungangia koreensis]|uniref:Methyl-accepting chemotaxis protein n=1 Tax=Chungangia koreensis TaxID=752657 RepID=A0ABV8X6B9_9LACT